MMNTFDDKVRNKHSNFSGHNLSSASSALPMFTHFDSLCKTVSTSFRSAIEGDRSVLPLWRLLMNDLEQNILDPKEDRKILVGLLAASTYTN